MMPVEPGEVPFTREGYHPVWTDVTEGVWAQLAGVWPDVCHVTGTISTHDSYHGGWHSTVYHCIRSPWPSLLSTSDIFGLAHAYRWRWRHQGGESTMAQALCWVLGLSREEIEAELVTLALAS